MEYGVFGEHGKCCSMYSGITEKAITRTKIFHCEHGYFCPFCHKRYRTAETLLSHLEQQDNNECFFRIGYETIQEAVFELKIYIERNLAPQKRLS